MTPLKNTILIADSLRRYLYGNCTIEEKNIVEKWLKEPANRMFFEEFKKNPSERILIHQDIDLKPAREQLQKEFDRKARFNNYRKLWLAAASVIILIGISAVFFLYNKVEPISQKEYIAAFKLFSPGENKAILSTSDGNKIVLEKNAPEKMITEKNGANIKIDAESISYLIPDKMPEVLIYNTIEVPRNGEHSLVLSDGTRVCLNSETKLRYPVSFIGNTREVYLEGEAYFEVAHNADKKFIVHTDKSILEVKGTSFNMLAYKDEANVATLVEGSIDIRHKFDENSTVSLKPGEQAQIISVNHKIKIKKVETLYYTAWKDGYFAYNNESLENIVKQLSRWYDFEYDFENDIVRKELFNARLRKYDNIGKIFYILEQTGKVKFAIEGGKVIVMKHP